MARLEPFDRLAAVVPAQAGTHNHRSQWRMEGVTSDICLAMTRRRGVWVPAFAGTTLGLASRAAAGCAFAGTTAS